MTTIRLRSSAELLATLPYHLGYHPQDCVVLVELRSRQLGLIERIDLPPDAHVAEAAASLVEPMVRRGATSVIVIGYESQVDAAGPLVDEVTWGLARDGIRVADTLVVRGDRYFRLDCDTNCHSDCDGDCHSDGDGHGDGDCDGDCHSDCHSDCCSAEGSLVPEPSRVSAVADFVAMGREALPSRASVADSVAASPPLCDEVDAAIRALERARAAETPVRYAGEAFGLPPGRGTAARDADAAIARTTAARRLRALSLWAAVGDRGDEAVVEDFLTPAQVAELVVSLEDRNLRDGVIAWWCPGSLPLDIFDADLVDGLRTCMPPDRGPRRFLVPRLQWLARSVCDERAAPVLTVLANVALHDGDGTLARVALDRALEHSPDYRLARLLSRLVDLGMRPGDLAAHGQSGDEGDKGDGRGEVVPLRSA